jgi:hypothetical protein
MHVAPSCVGSREGSDHFGSYLHNLPLHFCKRLFSTLEPITSWSQGNSFTAALLLILLKIKIYSLFNFGLRITNAAYDVKVLSNLLINAFL